MKTRQEHLAWCKNRALEYANIGDVAEAVASMGSDMGKHPETRGHPGVMLGVVMLTNGQMKTGKQAREWIEGFN